jgi:hypothetical protein
MPSNGTRPHTKAGVTPLAQRPGNLRALQLKLWRGVCRAEAIMNATEGDESVELQLKALNSFAQCCMAYLKSMQRYDYNTHPVGDNP